MMSREILSNPDEYPFHTTYMHNSEERNFQM
jgi:hypothetical protein